MEKYGLSWDAVQDLPEDVLQAMLTKNQVEAMHSRSREALDGDKGSASSGD